MYSKQVIYSALFITLLVSLPARSLPGDLTSRFTIQVAAFQDMESAQIFVNKLVQAGERPVWGTVAIPDRGTWIRILIGSFKTPAEARKYGDNLLDRGIIRDFLVRPAGMIASLGRPRIVESTGSDEEKGGKSIGVSVEGREGIANSTPPRSGYSSVRLSRSIEAPLPTGRRVGLSLAPLVDTSLIPRSDPVKQAFKNLAGGEVTGIGAHSSRRGGFWISGDTAEAKARLRWIAGEKHEKCLDVDQNGRVEIDTGCLAKVSGHDDANSLSAPLIIEDYISSNEGLLLLVQLTQGGYRYRLHIGRRAPTFGGDVNVIGSMNLDNNYDSRINPYRRAGNKLDTERPPKEFDSLIALNPVARWFNLRTRQAVHVSHITFHELVEAHAKVAYDLDYLSKGRRPGAHDLALDREMKLKAQRPHSDVVVTVGSNRLLRSEEEARQFYAESGISMGNQR